MQKHQARNVGAEITFANGFRYRLNVKDLPENPTLFHTY
jgi:nitrogen fixation protein